MPKCNCGAKHTRDAKNIHSDWCDAIRLLSPVMLENFGRFQFKRVDNQTIDVIIKDGNHKVGTLGYEFRSGIFNENHNFKDLRHAVLQCIEFLVDSINDDRMQEWLPYRKQALIEYNNRETKNDYWD